MKNFYNIVLALNIVVLLTTSCAIEKRHYLPGVFVIGKQSSENIKPRNLDFFINRKIDYSLEHANLIVDTAIVLCSTEKQNLEFSNSKDTNQIRKNSTTLAGCEDCDLIVMRNGDEIFAKVTEVSTNEIKYIRCDNLSGPTYVVSKSDVLFIKYVNGQKEVFAEKLVEETKKRESVEGFGLTGFIISVPSFVLLGLSMGVSGLFGLVAIVFGYISISKLKKSAQEHKGKGFAIASIIIGFIALILAIYSLFIRL